jgi:hypothetical protein
LAPSLRRRRRWPVRRSRAPELGGAARGWRCGPRRRARRRGAVADGAVPPPEGGRGGVAAAAGRAPRGGRGRAVSKGVMARIMPYLSKRSETMSKRLFDVIKRLVP